MSKKKEQNSIPADKSALYDALIATIPNLERKGAANPYTSFNGHMFSILSPDGSLGLRLPKEARESFLTRHNAHLREAFGIVQKEYVVVPDELFKNTQELKPFFHISYDYVKSLKPKPRQKKLTLLAFG
jgi:hypothetical protein